MNNLKGSEFKKVFIYHLDRPIPIYTTVILQGVILKGYLFDGSTTKGIKLTLNEELNLIDGMMN